MTAILVALIVVGGLVLMATIITVGLLVEDGKIGKKSPAKRAEEESIAAMYRAKEALYREAENRILNAGNQPWDQLALEILNTKTSQGNQAKQIRQGEVVCGHGYPSSTCLLCSKHIKGY